jgi:uroporphyrinogen decarboxylase
MNARERFLKIMQYQPVDQIPVIAIEPIEPSAIARWRKEGMPDDCTPHEYFKLDRLQWIPIDWSVHPPFEEIVISEDDEHIVKRDTAGSTVKYRKEDPTMYYGYIEHPVKTRRDWESYKQRFEADITKRLHSGWTLDSIRDLNKSENPVGFLFFPWLFRLGFYTMGMEKLLMTFFEDPDWMHDMFSFWSDFTMKLIEPVLKRVKIDYCLFAEDMAFKTSTHVSPRMYEEFWLPYQNKIVNKLKEHNVPVICHWSAGNLNPIIDTLLNNGINTIFPLENQADNMDAYYIRNKYGKNLLLGGGIAKEAVMAGKREIDKEIDRLMPLIKEGGFLPALDDMVTPDISFENYSYFIEKLKGIRL